MAFYVDIIARFVRHCSIIKISMSIITVILTIRFIITVIALVVICVRFNVSISSDHSMLSDARLTCGPSGWLKYNYTFSPMHSIVYYANFILSSDISMLIIPQRTSINYFKSEKMHNVKLILKQWKYITLHYFFNKCKIEFFIYQI